MAFLDFEKKELDGRGNASDLKMGNYVKTLLKVFFDVERAYFLFLQ